MREEGSEKSEGARELVITKSASQFRGITRGECRVPKPAIVMLICLLVCLSSSVILTFRSDVSCLLLH